MKILVVEDEFDLNRSIVKLLKSNTTVLTVLQMVKKPYNLFQWQNMM